MQVFTATCTGAELRKVWRKGSKSPEQDENAEGFRRAKQFVYKSHSFDDLESLRDLLNQLADIPNAALVLGQPLIESGGRTGLDFADVKTEICIVDLDSLEYAGTAEEAIRFALPFLHDRQFVYAFSQSSGFKSGHRLRVAFEVEPMDLTEQQIHAEHWNSELSQRLSVDRKFIDYGIYKPNGFVFTARPDLRGLDDPHPIRDFFVDGISGPVDVPKLPDMIEVEVAPAVTLGQLPTLRWDASNRHDSVLKFMVAYRTAFPESVFTDCWASLSEEYERLGVRVADRHEFGERYIKSRFHNIRGAWRKRKAFPTTRQEIPLANASQTLSDEIKAFVQAREPGVKVIEAEAGLGKTHWALHWLGVETRYEADINGMFFTDLYVPNHNLSSRIEADARSHGMTAYTELGRGQELNGRPVCTKHEAISKVQGIVKETRQTFCGNEMVQCSDRPGCIWWDQLDQSLTHDLRIRTHAHLPLQIAKEHGQGRVPNFVVIDENFLGALIKQGYVEVKDLCDVMRHDMGEWLLKLAQVIKAGITLDRLREAGFTVAVCKELI